MVCIDDFDLARKHLILGTNDSAILLAQYLAASPPKDIVDCALKFLVNLRFHSCKTFISNVLRLLQSPHETVTAENSSVKVFTDSRLTFIQLLLVCLEKGSRKNLIELWGHYNPAFQGNSESVKDVYDIAQKYMGVRLGGNAVNFGDLFSGMFRPPGRSNPAIAELD
jgi:hypothetical protein